MSSETFEQSVQRSAEIEKDLLQNAGQYRMLTGDRPTGALHVGHLFGSLLNRVRIQNLGCESYVVIADYQVLTDRDHVDKIKSSVEELVLDYLAVGLDPFKNKTYIFAHSYVPQLNQLLLPFLTLVTLSELDRNPTVKEEIKAAGLQHINASMYTYPIHQAADILFCKANIVPVGKDQLPHLELTRKIARRFNERFSPKNPVFPVPEPLLSETPHILGLDGTQKMSKSRNNAVFLKFTEDETVKAVKSAKTDADRVITYDPEKRPEVANLLRLLSLCTDESPETHASRIGDGGGGKLKATLSDALNQKLAPMRKRRVEFAQDKENVVKKVLQMGVEQTLNVAEKTLRDVRKSMNMDYGF